MSAPTCCPSCPGRLPSVSPPRRRSLAPCLRRGLLEPLGVHQGALPQLLFPVYYAYHRSLSTLSPCGRLPNPGSTSAFRLSFHGQSELPRSPPEQVELLRCLGCFHSGDLRRNGSMFRLSALVRLWIGDISSQRYILLGQGRLTTPARSVSAAALQSGSTYVSLGTRSCVLPQSASCGRGDRCRLPLRLGLYYQGRLTTSLCSDLGCGFTLQCT